MPRYNSEDIQKLAAEIQRQAPENKNKTSEDLTKTIIPQKAEDKITSAEASAVEPVKDTSPIVQQPQVTPAEKTKGELIKKSETAAVEVKSENKSDDGLKKKRKKKKHRAPLHWFTKVLIIVDVCAVICFGIAYGPLDFFRSWIVTTALTTDKHRYFAYILYSETTVKAIADANVTIESGDDSDSSKIVFTDPSTIVTYDSVYDEQILKKNEGNDLFKVIELKEDNYHGYVVAIYDPSKINLAIAKSKYGDTVSTFAKNNKARVAINGGGYGRYANDVIYTKGNIIINGKIFKNNGNANQMIGMKDNVLCLARQTAKQAIAEGWRWAVQFGPFLVVNGVSATFKGNGGYGIQPRTAIGQRKDGIMIFVVIDGRSSSSKGISMPNLTEVMVRYGCYNAANLDGGGSTTLVVDGNLTNQPRGDGWGAIMERHVYTSIIVTA